MQGEWTMQLMTHSRQDCFKLCRRKHKYSYLDGIRPVTDSKALRMGSAYHDAIEQLAKGRGRDAACEVIYSRYDAIPEGYETLEWEYERETVLRLACGYEWRWANDELTYLAAEQSFQLPLLNPATGAASKVYRRAGKIDGIVQSSDGRIGVKESKLLGEDIGAEASLWRRMQMDHQVTGYVQAARDLGYAASYVLYDVTRKPTIKPTAIPKLDELGVKIVVDANGNRVRTETAKTWRQTADKEKGYVLLTRPMTPEEWGDKLAEDIASRPDFYYARHEIARLDNDIDEYMRELWDIQQDMRAAERDGKHYRTVNRDTCEFCSYFGICVSNRDVTGDLPEGFQRVPFVHPELGELSHGDSSASRSDGPQAAASEACATST